MNDSEYVLHQTKTCLHCRQGGYVHVKATDLWDYLEKGKYAQDAFPYLTVGEVEQIISGTHPKCWNEMFPPETGDEDE